MLRRHYNSREIINTGELLVDGLLSDLIYQENNWHSLFGLLLTKNQFHKTGKGECDFILICEYGILVLEVKGGFISFIENQIIQKDIKGDSERNIDPFTQVRGNAQSVLTLIKAKRHLNVFVGEAVIFPESSFKYRGQSFKHYWHAESQHSLCEFLRTSLKEQARAFGFEKLKAKEIQQIINALSPEVNIAERPLKIQHSKKETERKSEQNLKILKGLEGNNRLLIEGPPGSGKSTYAKRVILDKVISTNIKVLYICWNDFLASHINHYFFEEGVDDKVTAMPFFDYVNSLFTILPGQNSKLNYDAIPQLYDHVDKLTTDLQSINSLPTYDLIVIDEAQDLFDKGIDIILDKQLNNGKNGLNRGKYIVFYDYLQAFDRGTNSEIYQLVYHTIKEYAAFYKLFDYFRVIEGSGIANFLDDALRGSIDFTRGYGNDMVIKIYKDEKDCIGIIHQAVKDSVLLEKITNDEIVVLFSSNLVSGNIIPGKLKPFDNALQLDISFKKIDHNNINSASDKIRYTSSLKFKGLEKDLVIVVIKDLYDEKIKTFYQMFIGVSRAKAKVVLLLDTNSAEIKEYKKDFSKYL